MTHNHEHCCHHDFKYCSMCDEVYCKKCDKEWMKKGYQSTWMWTPNTTRCNTTAEKNTTAAGDTITLNSHTHEDTNAVN